jgi:hypothetical protein
MTARRRTRMSAADREEVRLTIRRIIRVRFAVISAVFVLIAASSLAGLAASGLAGSAGLVLHGINAAAVLGLNAFCLWLVGRVRELRPLVLFQLAIDALNFTFTLYKTGGVASPLSFLYLGVIFEAGLLLGGTETFLAAGVCAGLYLGTVGLELLGLLPHQSFFRPMAGLEAVPAYAALSVLCTLFAMVLVASLAAYLAAELRRRNRTDRAANARLSRQLAALRLLQRTTDAVNSSRSVRGVADFILGQLLDFLRLDRALLYLAEGRQLRLFMVKYRGAVPPGQRAPRVSIPLRTGAGLTARVALQRSPVNVKDPRDSPFINRELQQRIGTNPFALAPLVARRRLVGVLGIDRSIASGEISDEEFQVLRIFAAQAAIAISALRK